MSVTVHDASDTLYIISSERNDLYALYWLACVTTAAISSATAVAFNNPNTAFITNSYLDRWHRLAFHQVLKELFILCLSVFILHTLVKAFLNVDIVQVHSHAPIRTFYRAVLCHLLK
ncbi:hypothetical protein D3C73_831320 [compost metagenome]